MSRISIMITGRSQVVRDSVRGLLERQPEFELNVQPTTEASPDPLAGVTTAMPDVLVLCLGPDWDDELRALGSRSGGQRPPMIVVGTPNDPAIMLRGMQAGARDFFSPPVQQAKLTESILRIARERAPAETPQLGMLTAVINSKGGSGGSTLAGNVAHILAVHQHLKVCLIDLDLQFGTLPLAFDMQLTNSILDALGATDALDPLALDGFMAKHASGLHLLGSTADQLPLPWEIPGRSLQNLLNVACRVYAHTVVDLPRQIDPLTKVALENAHQVLLVTQQSLAHIRDAKRMMNIMTGDLGVPREHIMVVVNRYQEELPISLRNIEDAVRPVGMMTVPNDFARVSEALNIGKPLYEIAPDAAITHSLTELAMRVSSGSLLEPAPARQKRSGIRSMLSGALGIRH